LLSSRKLLACVRPALRGQVHAGDRLLAERAAEQLRERDDGVDRQRLLGVVRAEREAQHAAVEFVAARD
jgi:hypothetical protein